MNMEERKAAWLARVYSIIEDQVPKRSSIQRARLIVSICQDAFNEGHKAGYKLGSDDTTANLEAEHTEMD